MSIRVCQNSFSKGILSPSLQARVDLEYYNLGVKSLQNGIVMQEGCIVNRPGLEFLTKAKYSTSKVRLIPFVFNSNQNYIIEAGDCYFRFIYNGAYVLDSNSSIYEIETPYTVDKLYEIDYVQQADVMTLVHKDYKPYELIRYAHNNWGFNQISFQASINPPQSVAAGYSGTLDTDVTTYYYVVTAVKRDTGEESSRSATASVIGHREAYWTTSEYILVSWQAVEDAMEYNIYRAVNGVFGYVGTSSGTRFIDNNIEPDLSVCAPFFTNPFENQNPSCVCYYQQRKVYACSNSSPQSIWASQSGTNDNFNISRPLNPNDSLSMTIHDNVANSIQNLIPFDDLIVMTTSAEWCVNGSDGVFCATPSPVAKLQSYYGSSKIKPVISGTMVLFVQSGGNIVRDLGYDYLQDSYDGEELTLLASHLFEGKKIVDIAYSKEPYRILWCVMDDGSVNALTYNPKQKIAAWHTHNTQGEFEAVAVTREGGEDIPYFVVKRKINNSYYRYIERLKSRIINTLDDAFFLDSALCKNFSSPVNRISGLEHLKNQKVNALLDLGVVENLEVNEDGEVELPYESTKVVIGLPYSFELETLNLESEGTLGIEKIINKVEVKVLNSREDFFVENDDGTLSQSSRSHASINNPEMLFNTDVEFCPLNEAKQQKSIKLIQKYPLPLSVLAINATISLGEVESR